MAANILLIENWDTKQIKDLLQTSPYKEGMKLFAVYLVSKGWSARKLEELFDVSFKQITTWVHDFNDSGTEGLQDKPKTGRNSQLTENDKNLLKSILLTKRPVDFDIKAKRWKGEAVIILISKVFKINYKKAQVYNIIKSLEIQLNDNLNNSENNLQNI